MGQKMLRQRIIFILSAILVSSFSLRASDYKIVSAFSGLTLRESPELSAKAITTIPYLEKVDIIKASDNTLIVESIEDVWYKVKWRNYEGWIFGGYLLPLDQTENLKFKNLKGLKNSKALMYDKTRSIRVAENKNIEFLKKSDISYAISFKDQYPILIILAGNAILDSYKIIDKKIKDNVVYYDDQEKLLTFTVQISPEGEISSGLAIFTVKLTQWSKDCYGFFIMYTTVSEAEGLPYDYYSAIVFENNRFSKNIWNKNSYEINKNECTELSYRNNSIETEYFFQDFESKKNKLVLKYNNLKKRFESK